MLTIQHNPTTHMYVTAKVQQLLQPQLWSSSITDAAKAVFCLTCLPTNYMRIQGEMPNVQIPLNPCATNHMQMQEHIDVFQKLLDWQKFIVCEVLPVACSVQFLHQQVKVGGPFRQLDNTEVYYILSNLTYGVETVYEIETYIKEQTCAGVWLMDMEPVMYKLRSTIFNWQRNMNNVTEQMERMNTLRQQQMQHQHQQMQQQHVAGGNSDAMVSNDELDTALGEGLLDDDFADDDFAVEDHVPVVAKQRREKKGRRGGRKH